LLLARADLVPALAGAVHEITGRCGGFIDVTSEKPAAERDGLAPSAPADELPPLNGRDRAIVDALQEIQGARVEGFTKSYSGNFKTRYARSQEGLNAPKWLASQWAQMAEKAGRNDVRVELVDPPQGYEQHSVRITFPGEDARAPIVLMGAHLDSINRGGDEAPGADDDASGIGALTETYRVLLLKGFKPRVTVQLFGYAAEELGLLGSRAIAERYQAENIAVRAAFQLDMVGYPGKTNAVTFITDHVDEKLTLWTQQLYGLYVGGDVKETRCGYACSDHASWSRYGYAAVFPFESTFEDMNHRIHSPRDVWDDQLDASHAAKFAKLAYAFLVELSR
jgi:leucyl aminopeptidase